jgi:hypothetical protein
MAGIFSKPKMPQLPKPVRMPDPEDPSIREQRRRRQEQMASRGGRDSTILSDGLMQTAGKMGA